MPLTATIQYSRLYARGNRQQVAYLVRTTVPGTAVSYFLRQKVSTRSLLLVVPGTVALEQNLEKSTTKRIRTTLNLASTYLVVVHVPRYVYSRTEQNHENDLIHPSSFMQE
jgi:DMSO/TMAO reductase YedYZ heme-binding membrane subunit